MAKRSNIKAQLSAQANANAMTKRWSPLKKEGGVNDYLFKPHRRGMWYLSEYVAFRAAILVNIRARLKYCRPRKGDNKRYLFVIKIPNQSALDRAEELFARFVPIGLWTVRLEKEQIVLRFKKEDDLFWWQLAL